MTYFIVAPFLLMSIAETSTGQTWTRLVTTNAPSPRRNASAIYDPVPHRIVLFGGTGASGSLNDLLSFDLATGAWQQIIPSTDTLPTHRFSQNAMFDSVRYRMLVWSGQGAGLFNDVWEFDLATSRWRELWRNGNTSNAPLIRYGTAAVFDPVNRVLVNFAGFTSSGRFEDTWEFHTDSARWIDRTNTPHPPMRCLHAGCLAGDHRMMIVYGGQNAGPLDDIWGLNLDNFLWSQFQPSTRPTGRYFPSCIYDNHGGVVVFGGQTSVGVSDELWRFSLASMTWELVVQGSARPSPRYGHTAVFVPSLNAMIIFGGSGAGLYDDTWQYTFTTTGVDHEDGLPTQVLLHQNFPNPFNPATTITYELPTVATLTLKVYNMVGSEVATLTDGVRNAGRHSVQFEGTNLASGVYVCSLESVLADGQRAVQTRKLVLMK